MRDKNPFQMTQNSSDFLGICLQEVLEPGDKPLVNHLRM